MIAFVYQLPDVMEWTPASIWPLVSGRYSAC